VSTSPPDLLAAILEATRRRVEADRSGVSTALLERRAAAQPQAPGFEASLRTGDGPRVIAECKRRSPSRGVLRWEYDPVAIAAAYEANGAAAVSVLTEPTFFDGSLEHLREVAERVRIPVLRKEFVIDPYQLLEAKAAGAAAVLLIVSALDDRQLRALHGEARTLGLDVLVEVHDDGELDRALALGATVIGVNNRNLRTLHVDLEASRRLVVRIPAGVVAVAESGLKGASDLEALGAQGYRAFLVGERLVAEPDPGRALAELLSRPAAVSGGQP
jgi:indole-3-glycerol phosphate synthase